MKKILIFLGILLVIILAIKFGSVILSFIYAILAFIIGLGLIGLIIGIIFLFSIFNKNNKNQILWQKMHYQ